MDSKKNERNTFLDVVKGALIILVVLGHIIQSNFVNFDDNLVFRFIYSFHMPLFIGISGYIAYLTIKEEAFIIKIWKKFKQLVIPFLSWYFLYSFFIVGIFKTTNISAYVMRLIKSPDYGLWFLWILFLCFVILFVINEFTKIEQNLIGKSALENLLFIIVIFLLFKFNVKILGFGLLVTHFPSFIIGYVVAKNIEIIKKYMKLILEITFIGFPILLFFWQRVSNPSIPATLVNILKSYTWVLLEGYRYLTALLGSIFFISFLYKITQPRIKLILEYLGKYTLDIYVIHGNLFTFIGLLGIMNTNSSLLSYSSILLSTAILICLSLIVSKFILRQSNVLTFLLLGNKEG